MQQGNMKKRLVLSPFAITDLVAIAKNLLARRMRLANTTMRASVLSQTQTVYKANAFQFLFICYVILVEAQCVQIKFGHS